MLTSMRNAETHKHSVTEKMQAGALAASVGELGTCRVGNDTENHVAGLVAL
jgi:hypothetical protein